jgi:ATP-binding protein involved in chromosome partitioning
VLACGGKGGVGKSTVAVNIAKSLQAAGKKVGIVDLNIMGSNVPTFLGMPRTDLKVSRIYLVPIDCGGIKVISVANMTPNDDQPIIFKGAKRWSFVQQLVKGSDWGDIDYLVADMPPATGDELMSLMEIYKGKIHGAVVVTIPSELSVIDAAKTLDFCQKNNIKIFGLVTNMEHFECSCGRKNYIYNHAHSMQIVDLIRKYHPVHAITVPIVLDHKKNVFSHIDKYKDITAAIQEA